MQRKKIKVREPVQEAPGVQEEMQCSRVREIPEEWVRGLLSACFGDALPVAGLYQEGRQRLSV